MKIMPEEEYQKIAIPLVLKVFNDSIFTFPDDYPFTDSIEAFLFLYPRFDEPLNTPRFWNTLRDEILKLGDTFVYEVDTLQGWCHNVYTLEPDKDCKLEHESTQAIVSSSGAWGLLGEFDRNSFLGGPRSFIKNIRESVPEIDEHIYLGLSYDDIDDGTADIILLTKIADFLTRWKAWNYGVDEDWLMKGLIRGYGEERAKELIRKAKEMGIF